MKIYYNTNTVNFNCNAFPWICRYQKCHCSVCTRGTAQRIVWRNKMLKMEKLWMIHSMLDKNKTSKHHAFTKETLYDDGDWFKAVPSNSIKSTVWNVKKPDKHSNKTYITTVLQSLKELFPWEPMAKNYNCRWFLIICNLCFSQMVHVLH
jgi:hypothetical protein